MGIIYTTQAVEYSKYCKTTGNKAIQKNILVVMERVPWVNKPEALKFELSGLWSRRKT